MQTRNSLFHEISRSLRPERATRAALTDVGVFQRTDVVRSVAAHQRHKAAFLQRRYDEFLLFGRDTCVDLDVGQQLVELLPVLVKQVIQAL